MRQVYGEKWLVMDAKGRDVEQNVPGAERPFLHESVAVYTIWKP